MDANLSNANLRQAKLSGAILVDVDLSNAKLPYADLRNATLIFAHLSGADLSGAKLRIAPRWATTAGGRPRVSQCRKRRDWWSARFVPVLPALRMHRGNSSTAGTNR
jgi:hypothetical protein